MAVVVVVAIEGVIDGTIDELVLVLGPYVAVVVVIVVTPSIGVVELLYNDVLLLLLSINIVDGGDIATIDVGSSVGAFVVLVAVAVVNVVGSADIDGVCVVVASASASG